MKRIVRGGIAAALALALLAPVRADLILGVKTTEAGTTGYTSTLVRFDSSTPGSVTQTAITGSLLGGADQYTIRALAVDPTQWRYGYDLGNDVDLKSGSLYPILVRLADRGLLEATWDRPAENKPPRHLYRLTTAGLELVAANTATDDGLSAVRRPPRLREA